MGAHEPCACASCATESCSQTLIHSICYVPCTHFPALIAAWCDADKAWACAEHGLTAAQFVARIPMCMHMWELIWPESVSEADKLLPDKECAIYNRWQADHRQQVFSIADTAAAKAQLLAMPREVVIPAS